ncbi:ComEA family DNA-binding protein [bacterium]|nr:ComEA family DNA-binding protein [bacterium]
MIVLIILTIVFFLLSVFSLSLLIYQNSNKEDDISVNYDDELDSDEDEKARGFKVEIKGEVINPGVYEVTHDNIIMDLIDLAGGLTENAYIDNINLSKKLDEEMVIIVYNKNKIDNKNNSFQNKKVYIDESVQKKESVITPNNTQNTESSSVDNGLININTASKEELMKLSGIGESKALKIIEYRSANGNFKAIEDIMKVNGIGKSTYEKFKDKITI